VKLKRLIIDRLGTLARTRSYHLIPEWSMEKQPLVRHLSALFARHGIDCVFDVGGNLGQYRDLLRDDVKFEGWIFSFEPVKKYADILKDRSLTDPKWKIHDFALGSHEHIASINVTKSPGLNSFLNPDLSGNEGYWTEGEIIETQDARVARLDDVFGTLQREYRFLNPYLKLDTQGFDLEVLKGGMQSLPVFKALQTEASVKPIYEGMPRYAETLKFGEEIGYELSGMFPVTHDDALRLVEFDCVMLNTARIQAPA
jgi:FkbM family methyltransferase